MVDAALIHFEPFVWRFFGVDVDAEVAILLHEGALDDDRALPKVLHEHSVVHILRDFATGNLDWHGKLLEKNQCIVYDACRHGWAPAVNSSTLVSSNDAVLEHEGSIE